PRSSDIQSARTRDRTRDGTGASPGNVWARRSHAVQLTVFSKGRVERAIRYVRDSFWAGRIFTTLAECNRQALVWRDEVAHRRPWPDDSARTVAQAPIEEQPRLLPLPLHLFKTDRMETMRSPETTHVHLHLNCYFVPPAAAGRP